MLSDACELLQSVQVIAYVGHEFKLSDLNVISIRKNILNSFMSNDHYILYSVVKYPSNHSDSY